MTGKLEGKSALVIGGGASGTGWGNGRAAAVLMAREGARVAVADVNRASAEETCRRVTDQGGEAFAITCDVSRTEDISATVEACVARFGAIDVLLNNVGISGGTNGLLAHQEDVWDRVFAINLRAVFTAVRLVVPSMIERGGGRIVNVSSTAALRVMGGAFSHAYAASKAGVIQFTRTVALEFASKGVRCNCVVPGMIDTPHAAGAIARARGEEEAKRIMARRDEVAPTGAQGTAWDVAHAVLYLSSDEAAYVNGVALVVDGGLTWATPVL